MKIKDFKEVHKSEWPHNNNKALKKVYLNGQFLVQEFHEEHVIRLTINQTSRKGNNRKDGITWDQLQEIKSKVGYADKCAVEVYPEDANVVNVSNMRHLFILPMRPDFAWTKIQY